MPKKDKQKHHCISPWFILVSKRFQDPNTFECIVFGHGLKMRTICNFSGECKDCPKYKEAKRKKIQR